MKASLSLRPVAARLSRETLQCSRVLCLHYRQIVISYRHECKGLQLLQKFRTIVAMKAWSMTRRVVNDLTIENLDL